MAATLVTIEASEIELRSTESVNFSIAISNSLKSTATEVDPNR